MSGDHHPLQPEELQTLPVFPLPRVVFFPGSLLPLHLFEPRYRAMIEDCLAHGPMAMSVTLLKPGWEDCYEGRPAIYTVAGAGRIVHHERLPNGTHNIVLRGLTRARLDELPPDDRPYRRAQATPLAHEGTAPREEVTALLSVASNVASIVQNQHPSFTLGVSHDDSPARIADIVADRLVADTTQRQEILETLDVLARVRLVTKRLGELMLQLSGSDGPAGPPQ